MQEEFPQRRAVWPAGVHLNTALTRSCGCPSPGVRAQTLVSGSREGHPAARRADCETEMGAGEPAPTEQGHGVAPATGHPNLAFCPFTFDVGILIMLFGKINRLYCLE